MLPIPLCDIFLIINLNILGGGFSVGFENVGVKISYTKFRGGGVTSLRGMLLRLSMNPLLVIFYTFLCVKLLKERINIFKHLLNKWTIL